METLKYKTRGESSPSKKQNVYYTAHKEDFNVYFSEITDEILSKYDVAIWYKDEEIVSDEEHLSNLSEMSLFVIPITTQLLTTNNYVLDKEYQYAVENHIPVLPIMVEDGLVELFNTKIGNIQYLDKINVDITTISYEEKLKKYLDSIIVGKELTEKIKESFEAYIFLSYRKKDRIYAQKLMKKIHSFDDFRDVAIWYDEYLTPGENFDQEIINALEKSDVFVLVVTPNLVNEVNYIMNIEYPRAKKSKKNVLPIQLIPTDISKIKEKYPDILELIDFEDNETIIKCLKEVININTKNNAEHLYLMGLAYLIGVDVEINHEMAVKLITDAAQDNLIEAIEKLTNMYHNGEGVKIDYEEEIKWREKLVKTLKEKYNKTGLEEDGNKLFWETIYLGDAYYDIRQNEKVQELYLKALDVAKKQAEKYDTINSKRNVAIGYSKIGILEYYFRNLLDAEEYFLKSLTIIKNISEQTKNIEYTQDLSIIYNRLGNIEKTLHNIEVARDYYLKSLDLALIIDKEINNVLWKTEIGMNYNKLGDLEKGFGHFDEAREYYLKSFKIFRKINDIVRTNESLNNVSRCYNKLGSIEELAENYEKAKDYFLKALNINLTINEEIKTIDSKKYLGMSYNTLGNIEYKLDNKMESENNYRKALEIALELVEKTNESIEARRYLAICNNKMAKIKKGIGELEQAKEYVKRAIKINEKITVESSWKETERDLRISYNMLANIDYELGEYKEAKEYFLKVITIVEKSLSFLDGRTKYYLLSGYEKLYIIEASLGNLEESNKYLLKLEEIRSRLEN